MVGKATETVKAAVCSLLNVVYALLRAVAHGEGCGTKPC